MHRYKRTTKITHYQIKFNTSSCIKINMVFKVIVFAASLALANAGLLGAPALAAGPAIAAPIAYSPATAVSSISYSSPIVSYGTPIAAQTPAITSQSQNILRSFGNLGQVSTYSKTIDTPFSSVRKTDVRVSNPGLRVAAVAPALQTYTSPVLTAPTYAAPALAAPAYAAPAYAAPALAAPAAVTYSAAPAVSHVTFQGLGSNYVF